MNSIQYRKPVLADAPAVAELVRDCPELDNNSQYAYILLCQHFAETCVVGENGERIVGFLSAYRPPPQRGTVVFVWQVAVHHSARGQGIAGSLLDELLKRDACADVEYLDATITPSNEPSRALFRSLARRHETGCETSPLFSAELFGGEEHHEPEDLFHIGPFQRSKKQSKQSNPEPANEGATG